jgi:N6-adenosine-specific RNA methylase IME4
MTFSDFAQIPRGHYGAPRRLSKGVREVVLAPRREHSRKPEEIYPAVESLVAGPYLELFARQHRAGWDCWGNQTSHFATASSPFPLAPSAATAEPAHA